MFMTSTARKWAARLPARRPRGDDGPFQSATLDADQDTARDGKADREGAVAVPLACPLRGRLAVAVALLLAYEPPPAAMGDVPELGDNDMVRDPGWSCS